MLGIIRFRKSEYTSLAILIIGEILSKRGVKENGRYSVILPTGKAFSDDSIVFNNDYVEYEQIKIYYRDALVILFHSTTTYWFPLFVSKSYKFVLASGNAQISVSFSGARSQQENIWAKMIELSRSLVIPEIVRKLVDAMFSLKQPIVIGGVVFDSKGYGRSKLFGRKEFVLWNEQIYAPEIESGNVVFFKEKNGEKSHFKSIKMYEPNAVVIPELIDACKSQVTKQNNS